MTQEEVDLRDVNAIEEQPEVDEEERAYHQLCIRWDEVFWPMVLEGQF